MQEKAREMVKEYWKEVCGHKIRLSIAGIITVGLFLVSYYYLFEGFNKRFIIFSALCLLTGALIAFPIPKNNIFSVIAVVLYLIGIPGMMFRRIEFPIHDMSQIQEGVQFVSILIIFLVFAVFLLISQSTRVALGGGSCFLLIMFLINYYVVLFRGSGLSYNDLKATSTALSVIDNYRLSMNAELWYSILYFCFFIAAGFWCKVSADLFKKRYLYHIIVSGVAVIYMVSLLVFWNYSDYLEERGLHGHYWNGATNQAVNGFLLSFAFSIQETSMEKPENYSDKVLQGLMAEIEREYQKTGKGLEESANIILIMNEAWSDLRVLGNVETSEPYMPFIDSLKENTIRGNLYVGVLGGLTANTEFEVLTGDTLAFLDANAIPYQLQVNREMSSLASVLKEQGYATVAMHPSGKAAWNREKVYEYFGFDKFIDEEQFQTEYGYVRSFISDECNFNEIIYQFENKQEGQPLFLFNVTIQNHGAYYGDIELPIQVNKVGQKQAEEIEYLYDAQTYLNLMKITDEAFEKLITYFESVDEPTIICMFGDHQPALTEFFYEAVFAESSTLSAEQQRLSKYVTPYIIWSNFDSEFSDYGDMSANYLGAAVLECADVTLPPYYKFLLNLREEYPVMTHLGCMDEQGVYGTIDEWRETERIVQYRMLQYNHLIDTNCQRSLFSVAKD